MTLARKLHLSLGTVTLGWLCVVLFWGPAPFAGSFDDAYYYFTIGRNWAQGNASTFDGIDRTNGYHPLWQLICTLPYLVGLDGLAAVRSLLIFQLALWAGALWLVIGRVASAVDDWPGLDTPKLVIAKMTRDRRWCDGVVVVAFVALCANPYLFKMTVNGLESGLVVPIGAVLITWSLSFSGRFASRTTRRQRFAVGGLLALAFLARTDAVILIAAVVVWCLLDAGTRAQPLGLRPRIQRTFEVLMIPLAVIAAYSVANQVIFDTALQISGTVKRLPITPLRIVLAIVWAAVGVGILAAARRPIRKTSRFVRTRRFFAATAYYATFCVGLVGYYTTLQEVPYLWYFAPLALLGTFLALLLTADLAERAIVEAAEADGKSSRFATRAPALILLVPLVAAFGLSIPGYVDPGARSLLVHDATAGRWINHHLPPDARIASWDAGAIGYFAHRNIVNLDGVVNSHEYYEATNSGGVPEFLAERDVGWVVNHGGNVNGRDPDIKDQIRNYFGAEHVGEITVVYRDLYDYTGTLDGSRTDSSTKQMGTYVYRIDP